MSFIKSLFFRRKRAPLACSMSLDANHVHGDACFAEIRPLAIAELFQSQGCSSCLPSIPAVHQQLGHNPNVLLLTYNVTYWDRLGWKDTFGNAAWDARQKAYVKRWSRDGVFTPQLVVDGVADGVGRADGEITDLLSKAIETRNNAPFTVGIERVSDQEVKIASEQVEAAVHDVLLIVYDPEKRTVKIEKGENKRKNMAHLNVVKEVVKIEEWSGGVRNVGVPQVGGDGLERVIVVQQGVGGAIVAALKI